jgi:COMPASS component SWD3
VHEDNAPVTTVRFSPNGRYILAFTLDSCIRLWDYVSGTCKKTYQGHVNNKYSLGGTFGVSNNEAFIVSGSEDGDIIFWDVKTKDVVQRVTGHEGAVCWVDHCTVTGKIASGGLDGTVRMWIPGPVEGRVNGTSGIHTGGDERADEYMMDLKDGLDAGFGDDTPRDGRHMDIERSSEQRGVVDDDFMEDDVR